MGSVTTEQAERPAPPKRKRGRETTLDMVRSLGVVMILVVALWFFGQPSRGDARPERVVDPSSDIRSFSAAVPRAPTPGPLPQGWRATSSTLAGSSLRIGYLTPGDQYTEYSAMAAAPPEFLSDSTAAAAEVGPVDVAGTSWTQYRDADGRTSLARTTGTVTVVVGGFRGTASPAELTALAGSVAVR